MGQPTASLTQRVGKTQFWQTMPVTRYKETTHADQIFKLQLATALSSLICSNPPLIPRQHLWVLQERVTRLTRIRNDERHGAWKSILPNVRLTRIARLYLDGRVAEVMSDDPISPLTISGFMLRKGRTHGLFWGQARSLRIAGGQLLLLRAYNIGLAPVNLPLPADNAGRHYALKQQQNKKYKEKLGKLRLTQAVESGV